MKPGFACGPWNSTSDDSTLPPDCVTAAATRCNSAAPATVTVEPSTKGEPDAGENSAALPGLEPTRPSRRLRMSADDATADWVASTSSMAPQVANPSAISTAT